MPTRKQYDSKSSILTNKGETDKENQEISHSKKEQSKEIIIDEGFTIRQVHGSVHRNSQKGIVM